MFGYVRVCKPLLTCGDYERYRGVYCSLCRALGRRYGPAARLTLSYDAAFYALLALSRAPEAPEFRRGRCGLNPFKRCHYCNHSAFARTADVSMLLAYYKWRDQLEDSGFWGRLLWRGAGLLFLGWGRRAKRRAPEAEGVIRTAMAAQRLVEHSPSPSLDQCAHPSAQALGSLCALMDERFYRLGYLLGRWVYLADAAEDGPEDRKRGRFNAFAAAGGDPSETLSLTAAELAREFEPLELPQMRPILENILTLGLYAVQENILPRPEEDWKGADSHEKPL